MTTLPQDIDPSARKARLDAVVFAVGSLRLEGRITSPEFQALQERFMAGKITEEQCRLALLELYNENALGNARHTPE